MKNLKKLTIMFYIFCLITLLPIISKAGMEINNKTVWTGLSASDAYDVCQDLNKSDSTLGNSNLEAHLTLNKDWGAVSYLAESCYGGTASGSTTGNASGVYNLGSTYTLTSCLREDRSSTTVEYVKSLEQNKNTKYVEIFNDSNTLGMDFSETDKWDSKSLPTSSEFLPYRIGRHGVKVGFSTGYGGYKWCNNGAGEGGYNPKTTFRPVIWNK